MKQAKPVLLNPSISHQIYLNIKSDIMSGEYKPGERLLVLDLAKRFEVSQAPVREALERLKFEELIIGTPNKGSVVSSVTPKEIRDIFELREMIEVYTVRKVLPLLKEDDFDRMKASLVRMGELVDKGDMLGILESDLEFHGHLYELSGNSAILDVWNRIQSKMMRFMAISNKYHTTEFLVEEHYILLEMLKGQDIAATEARFLEHIDTYKIISF
ncbi:MULTISPECIES: GntR family transcriptional regulator [Paenibacillus]|uniref:GntR family transcriptional regulator n=1 Tax=Paenibacillus TaxID=44249 RepID=UPI001F272CD6|nr:MULTISPECIES: GntR family transcriptional regulator [Paenibacillus]